MGFFSDLKEDLSQAVNELMPDEETEAVKGAEAAAQEDTLKEAEAAADAHGVPEAFSVGGTADEGMSLDEMLQNIDSIRLPEDTEEESTGDLPGASANTESVDLTAELAGFGDDIPEEILVKAEEPAGLTAEEEISDTEENTEEIENDWDLDSMLENALTEEKVETAEKTEEYKGVGKTMEMNTGRVAIDETSVITAGMTITGDIVSEGSLDIIGTVNGNIDLMGKLNITGHIDGNSKAAEIFAEGAKINGEVVSDGAVKIGASTVIVGNITAASAAIAGAVKGDIDVHGPVILDASAIVMGNIKSKSVQINNGAVIEGMCSQCYADVNPTSFFEDYKMETKKVKTK